LENIKLALKYQTYLNTEVSKKIPAKILALVGVKDPVTEQQISGELLSSTLLIISSSERA
jgi:hypothetical protein